MSEVKLGYALTDGHGAVNIPIRHMVVAGQTQEAGKTTTLEALIARSGKTAIAFVTKRGEQSFSTGRRIQPYFRERADWQFVASILEATMRERMKFERSWIINASRGARTLADVHRNVKKALQTARGISEGVYTSLDAYLEIVVPRIEQVEWAKTLELERGLNVLDVSDRGTFPSELQGLVMRSVIEWVYEHAEDTITIIPEAWEFLPQARGSPVKLAATELIRKGAGLRNYVWLDSQDIGGIDKEILRSCPVWLLGVQREANEIKRTLANIPDTTAKPKPGAIAMLERGQFFACHGKHAVKTYVQPAWLDDARAQLVATGAHDVHLVHAPISRPPAAPPIPPDLRKPVRPYEQPPKATPEDEEETMKPEDLQKVLVENNRQLVEQLRRHMLPDSSSPAPVELKSAPAAGGVVDEDRLFERFRARLLKDPVVLKVLATQPELQVQVQRVTVDVNSKSVRGMMAILLSEGFFDAGVIGNAAFKEAQRRFGYSQVSTRIYEQIDWLHTNGFLTKEADNTFKAVPGMKVNVIRP